MMVKASRVHLPLTMNLPESHLNAGTAIQLKNHRWTIGNGFGVGGVRLHNSFSIVPYFNDFLDLTRWLSNSTLI